MDKLIFLSKQYVLVVGDTFELFYRGVIRSMNPYKYYIHVVCDKGNPFPRYFSYTPKENEEGKYKLTISLYDDYHNLIESGETVLNVSKPEKPKRKMNILCIGDSLTFNGMWPYEGYRRFTQNDGEPKGLGFSESLNMIGTCKKEEVGYEGYGGWQWRHFCLNEAFDASSGIWVELDNNPFDENDQHSIWMCDNLPWVMESIEKNRIKFKRGLNNYFCGNTISNVFNHISGGVHHNTIEGTKYYFDKGNPFWNEETKGPDFKKYILKNNFPGIDYVYILLTWNGQFTPFNHDFSHFDPFIRQLIDQIHKDFKDAKIRLMGIQSPSINGGIAFNYGASGYYSDVFGEVSTAFFYDEYLEKLCSEYDFCKYIDTKAQFDVEYNMPAMMKPVNTRSSTMERIGTNGVHPTNDGYLQIGDVFYRALVSDMKNEK